MGFSIGGNFDPISTGLGIAGGVASSIFGAKQARKNRNHQLNMQRIQNEYNAKQAELSFQRNRDEWTRQFDLQNAYNDPSAQMDRFRKAGINPYMASVGDGNSGASVSASGSTAASSSPVPYADAYSNPGSDFLQGVNNTAQSALSVYSALEKSHTYKSDIASRIADNLLNSELYGVKKEALESALKSQASKNNYDAAYYTLKLNKVDDIFAQEFAQMMARTEELITQVRLNETNEKLAYQKEREIRANFETWKEGFFLDNQVKEAQRDSINTGTKQSWQYMNNALADSAQSRRESSSRIALNGMLGSLYGVEAALGRQQFGFNGIMNPILITQGKYNNRKLWHEGSSAYYNAKHASYFTPEEQIFFDNPTLNSIDKWAFGIGSALDNITKPIGNIGKVSIGFGRNSNVNRSFNRSWNSSESRSFNTNHNYNHKGR